METLLVFLVIVAINIIFGYWRANTRRFSLQWILSIHIPVPIAIGLRLMLLGWHWVLVTLFVVAFTIGQYGGGIVRKQMKKTSTPLSSFLIADLGRLVFSSNKSKACPR